MVEILTFLFHRTLTDDHVVTKSSQLFPSHTGAALSVPISKYRRVPQPKGVRSEGQARG